MDIEHTAIERLKIASDLSLSYYDKPLDICYSGGKDSEVLIILAKRAGIPFAVQHSHTTVDAPPTVQHIRKVFRNLELDGIKTIYTMPSLTMWQLIVKKMFPPTRLVRYCCSDIKETYGNNSHVVTGVRKAESVKRNYRNVFETITSNKNNKILLGDNDDRRKLTEVCMQRGRTVTNAIIDWTDTDVWDFLDDAKADINPLYGMGFKRVGCIGCPMASSCRKREFSLFPTYKRMYIRTFDKMLEARKAAGLVIPFHWTSGENVFRWWMEEKFHPDQVNMFEEENYDKV